jgi:predicted nucleotide-binding protein
MAEQNKSEKATTLLKQKLGEADDSALASNEFRFSQWVQEVEGILVNRFVENSRQLKNFRNSLLNKKPQFTVHEEGKDVEYRRRQISYAKATLEAILSERETFGPSPGQAPTAIPKVFIAHGGKTEALAKLQTFMDALGITPLVAEEAPSEGRSVDQQVEWCLNNADCALILGTADDKDLRDGKLYPRRNVHIEIGRVEERLPGKVIYLLEEGASFPSDITEKIHERFTEENMEEAFLKVAKELKAFGIIRAVSIRS